ncbi:hypothetical protein D5018_14080 [Parashewanella curva]|uniref:Uncharacterized protein n=1 Tax=Parashewanella curva TaxID=2338552 RepID=A0A3L8PUU1_9GAMM|nr:hypothetical protein D5018_14080 [Parashewanella curva]
MRELEFFSLNYIQVTSRDLIFAEQKRPNKSNYQKCDKMPHSQYNQQLKHNQNNSTTVTITIKKVSNEQP